MKDWQWGFLGIFLVSLTVVLIISNHQQKAAIYDIQTQVAELAKPTEIVLERQD